MHLFLEQRVLSFDEHLSFVCFAAAKMAAIHAAKMMKENAGKETSEIYKEMAPAREEPSFHQQQQQQIQQTKTTDDAKHQVQGQAKDEQKKPVDKSRPVSSSPVPGTPWSVLLNLEREQERRMDYTREERKNSSE
jgi:hypothetical protein